MQAIPASSIFDLNIWRVWALPVQGPGNLVKICNDKREALESARALNHATPWVFHDVRRHPKALPGWKIHVVNREGHDCAT